MVAGGGADLGATEGAEVDGFGVGRVAGPRHGKADAAFGFVVRPAGACDAGDGDAEMGCGLRQCAVGHRFGDLFGDGAEA